MSRRADSPHFGWRLAGAAALLLLTAACSASQPSLPPPGLALAPLADVPDGGVLHTPANNIFLVDSPDEGLIALRGKDPYLGCRLTYVSPEQGQDNVLVTFDETRFVDACHGSQYDGNGLYLFGPSPRSMDRIPIDVIGGTVYVDGIETIQVPRPGSNG